MKPELQKKLYDKYPKLLEGMTKSPQQSCLAFGIECGDGWYDIIDTALGHVKDVDCGTIIQQIKEKYGTLRIYAYGANDLACQYLDDAETQSERTCENCGEPGKIVGKGWLTTLCEKCNTLTQH